MVGTLVQLLHTRVELFTTELEEEMHRIAVLLVWSAVSIFCSGLFVLMLSLTVVIAFWDGHRLLAASVMTTLLLLMVVISLLTLRAKLKGHPRLLAASRDELRRDGEALGSDPELPG